MIKQLVTGLTFIIMITIIMMPITFVIAGIMESLMPDNLMTTILVTIVRYFGFFIGIGTLKWIYKGLLQQEQQQGGLLIMCNMSNQTSRPKTNYLSKELSDKSKISIDNRRTLTRLSQLIQEQQGEIDCYV